jgi:predicted small metal-binding protein
MNVMEIPFLNDWQDCSIFMRKYYLLIFISRDLHDGMAKLKCSDYGFECDFVAEGQIEQVIEEFGKHTEDVHGIDYSKEALMQFILRKK